MGRGVGGVGVDAGVGKMKISRLITCYNYESKGETMIHTIAISETLFSRLENEAKRSRLSPSELAERLLAERLSVERQVWQKSYEQLIARVHSRMSAFNSAEIEADITAASDEVKAEHRANRRSS